VRSARSSPGGLSSVAFASACAAGELRFNATLSPEAMMARLMSLPGIGPPRLRARLRFGGRQATQIIAYRNVFFRKGIRPAQGAGDSGLCQRLCCG
jgi:hypothetical protein